MASVHKADRAFVQILLNFIDHEKPIILKYIIFNLTREQFGICLSKKKYYLNIYFALLFMKRIFMCPPHANLLNMYFEIQLFSNIMIFD